MSDKCHAKLRSLHLFIRTAALATDGGNTVPSCSDTLFRKLCFESSFSNALFRMLWFSRLRVDSIAASPKSYEANRQQCNRVSTYPIPYHTFPSRVDV